jgi:transposase-like protein
MPKCKKRGLERPIKNGVIAGKQRYRRQECGCNFREGDNRTNESAEAKKALRVLLYAMTKGSFRMMGRILGIDYALVYRWIRSFGESLPEPEVPGDITEMEFDEMWHFVGSKKQALAHQSR